MTTLLIVGSEARDAPQEQLIHAAVERITGEASKVIHYDSGEALSALHARNRVSSVILDTSLSPTERAILQGAAANAGIWVLALTGSEHENLHRSNANCFHLEGRSVQAAIEHFYVERSRRGQKDEAVPLKFRGFDADEPAYIVCAEIPEILRPTYGMPSSPDYLRLSTFADVDAMVQLHLAFASAMAKTLKPYTHRTMPHDALNANLIIVGGPAWNGLTARVQEAMDLPYRHRDGGPGNPDPIIDPQDASKLHSCRLSNGDVVEDVGLFVRAPSPFNPNREVVVCSGVLTHGVEGAALLFTDRRVCSQNEEFARSQFGTDGYFAVLFRVDVVANINIPPLLTKTGTVLSKALWTQDHGFVH